MTAQAIASRLINAEGMNQGAVNYGRKIGRWALMGTASLIGIGVVFGSYFSVEQYERGIVTRGGEFVRIAEPGYNFKVPFLEGVSIYRVDIQQLVTPKLNTYTVDNQEVDATLTIQWQIPVEQLGFVYTNTPAPQQQLTSMAIDRFKVEAGRINVTQFANERGTLVKNVYNSVKDEAQRLYHLKVTDVQLTNLDYQESFRSAQAQAAVVKTQIEQAQGLKAKAEFEAQTAKVRAQGERDAAIEKANGEAAAIRAKADADAHATEVKGRAEAEAQKLMAQALAENASLTEYQKAIRWNGQLPQNVYAGAPIPFLNVLQGAAAQK